MTGANSALGRALLERAGARGDLEIIAIVRSKRAAAELPTLPVGRVKVAEVDFRDAASLSSTLLGSQALVHLSGVLVETKTSRYAEANVNSTKAALSAAHTAGVAKFVLVSATHANARSANPYLRSKGEAEAAVRASGIPYTILRCPLVLAAATAGAHALARDARKGTAFLLGGGVHHEQPLDARDLVDAALSAALDSDRARNQVLELVGPEALTLAELVRRTGKLAGRTPRIFGFPRALARLFAGLRGALFGPGFSPAVIEVLTLDTRLDPAPAARALGLELRPLDETLRATLARRNAT